MTLRPPRNDHERIRIVNAMENLGRYLGTLPHTVSNHRAAIRLRMRDGLRAANYDGDGRSSGSTSSVVEREALARGDSAADADFKLDSGLAHIAHGMDLVQEAIAPFPIFDQGQRDKEKQQPGKGVCPVGKCATCWERGRDEVHDDRYRNACRWCGDWKAAHGQKPPAAIWRIHHEQGKRVTTADLRKHAPHLLPSAPVRCTCEDPQEGEPHDETCPLAPKEQAS